jgi:hypothetical protein
VDSVDEALAFVQTHRRMQYAAIVHEYIDVARSFEILIDKNLSLVEHVPGMWESDNQLHPDVILVSAQHCKVYRFRDPRPVVLGIGESDGTSCPLTDDDIRGLLMYVRAIREVVMSSEFIRRGLPVVVHAVWDRSSRDFQCLNLRQGRALTPPVGLDEFRRFHLVKDLQDIEEWDGTVPLRVALRTTRGTEASLVELARRLAKTGVPIAVDFGLLSHPAIVLREYGNRIYPSYLVPAFFQSSEYEYTSFPLDIADNAVQRILRERPVRNDEIYHIVFDRAPIGHEHFLAVNKCTSPSVKDTREIERVVAIFENITCDTGPFFFERGRATFCTSGFTDAHEHFHVIGGLDNAVTFEALLDALGLQSERCFRTIDEAYRYAPESGEYCLFGSSSTGFAVSGNRVAPGQLLRRVARVRF